MQLKECMEDTADNKVWGDWMLINLCVLCSVQFFCLSSSLSSCSRLSKPPLNGMTKAPGSWLSTHSLIFTSLGKNSSHKTSWSMWLTWKYVSSVAASIFMRAAEHTVGACAGDCTRRWRRVQTVWRSFRKSFKQNISCGVWWSNTESLGIK